MLFVSLAREVQTRVMFHSKPGGMLEDLNFKKSGEFRIDGTSDLPQYTLIDLAINDQRGTSSGTLSSFLRTKLKHDWYKLTDDGEYGLIDWMELIMDAIETRPSDMKVDQLLTLHNADGTIYLDESGAEYPQLLEPFTWSARMSAINEVGFTLQMDMNFKLVQTMRANRRKIPFAPQ